MSSFAGVVAIDSPLARRNPTVKLALLTVVSLVAMFLLEPITPAVLYVLGLLGVAMSVRVPLRILALAHLPFFAFAFGVFVVNALSRPGTILWQGGLPCHR